MEIELRFAIERETKNTVRFQEVTSTTPVIGPLYVRKTTFPGGHYPDEIRVTIHAALPECVHD